METNKMWIADGWKDYEVLDTSGGEKLERWGDYLLVRPDPQVIWNTKKEYPSAIHILLVSFLFYLKIYRVLNCTFL